MREQSTHRLNGPDGISRNVREPLRRGKKGGKNNGREQREKTECRIQNPVRVRGQEKDTIQKPIQVQKNRRNLSKTVKYTELVREVPNHQAEKWN